MSVCDSMTRSGKRRCARSPNATGSPASLWPRPAASSRCPCPAAATGPNSRWARPTRVPPCRRSPQGCPTDSWPTPHRRARRCLRRSPVLRRPYRSQSLSRSWSPRGLSILIAWSCSRRATCKRPSPTKGLVTARRSTCLDIAVSPSSLDRALRIVEALLSGPRSGRSVGRGHCA